MNKDLTDITVVLDRSGSMESCRTDAEGGLNAFVKRQAGEPGAVLYTLVQFDTAYEFVHKGVPIASVPPFRLHPRGSTALYDAVGRAINETGTRLAAMQEADRPGLVVFAIITDGEENSSREFTGAQIRAMIERQTTKYNWQFTYLGANQDAFQAAGAIGISADSTLNYATAASPVAFDNMAENMYRMKSATKAGRKAESVYTDAERSSSVGEKE